MKEAIGKLLEEVKSENSKAMDRAVKSTKEETTTIVDFSLGRSAAFEFVIVRLKQILNDK